MAQQIIFYTNTYSLYLCESGKRFFKTSCAESWAYLRVVPYHDRLEADLNWLLNEHKMDLGMGKTWVSWQAQSKKHFFTAYYLLFGIFSWSLPPLPWGLPVINRHNKKWKRTRFIEDLFSQLDDCAIYYSCTVTLSDLKSKNGFVEILLIF